MLSTPTPARPTTRKLRRLVQQFRRNFRRAAHNQRVRVRYFRAEASLLSSARCSSPPALQQFYAALADLVRNNDFHLLVFGIAAWLTQRSLPVKLETINGSEPLATLSSRTKHSAYLPITNSVEPLSRLCYSSRNWECGMSLTERSRKTWSPPCAPRTSCASASCAASRPPSSIKKWKKSAPLDETESIQIPANPRQAAQGIHRPVYQRQPPGARRQRNQGTRHPRNLSPRRRQRTPKWTPPSTKPSPKPPPIP